MPKFNLAPHWDTLKERVRNLDLFATRRVHPRYHKGMKMFWWDGLLATVSGAFVDTYASLYVLALGATSTQIGAMSSASSFLSALTPLPGAELVRRMGKRKPLIVGVSVIFRILILLAALVPLGFSGQPAIYIVIALFALRAGLGNLIHPAWVSLTGDVVPIEHRGNYFSMRNTVMALASMLLVPLAGWIIDSAGAPQGYQWSLALAFGFGLLSSFAYSRIPETTPVSASERGRISFWEALRGKREFLYFTLIMLLWTFGVQLAGSYFGVFQIQGLGSTSRIVGLMATVSATASMIGQRFWGRIVDQRGSRWVMTLCALLIPTVPWTWSLLTKPWHVSIVQFSGGFLWAGFNIASFNLLLELPDQKLRTQATASYATLVNAASIIAPLIGGLIIEHLGYRQNFIASGCVRITAAVLFTLLLKPFKFQKSAIRNEKSVIGNEKSGMSVEEPSPDIAGADTGAGADAAGADAAGADTGAGADAVETQDIASLPQCPAPSAPDNEK